MTETKQIEYVPEIGAKVKLATREAYSKRNVGMWAWLEVRRIYERTVFLAVLNGLEPTGEHITAELGEIEKPIGWKPVYTIHAKPEQLEMVLEWLSRGVVVRQSQYIGDCSTQFQPLDTDGQCHWKFGSVTDKVPACDVVRRVRVVEVIEHEVLGLPMACRYCSGSGQRIAGEHQVNSPNIENAPKAIGDLYHCWTCKGTGHGTRYLSELGKPERKRYLDGLRAEGWDVWYVRYGGGYWMQRKERVVVEVSE